MTSTSQEDPLAFAQYVPSVKYGEKKAIVSSGNSDSGSLSPSCTSKASSGKSQTWDCGHYPIQADVLERMQFLTSISAETTATKNLEKIFVNSIQPKVQEQPIK